MILNILEVFLAVNLFFGLGLYDSWSWVLNQDFEYLRSLFIKLGLVIQVSK